MTGYLDYWQTKENVIWLQEQNLYNPFAHILFDKTKGESLREFVLCYWKKRAKVKWETLKEDNVVFELF